ncbi:caspase recruitment domain-containing protein 19-like isoform 1-T1 [Menidia menidia]
MQQEAPGQPVPRGVCLLWQIWERWVLRGMMSSSRVMPHSCAAIREWTPSWLIDWCCSSTGSTPRYSVTRKPARRLSEPADVRLSELLKHLHEKGEEACHEFYQALHIHAEEVYASLPTRSRQREMADAKWTKMTILQEPFILNDKGTMFFLCCFSFVVGIAVLYYYGEGETLRCPGAFLPCSAARFSKDAKDVFVSYAEVGK